MYTYRLYEYSDSDAQCHSGEEAPAQSFCIGHKYFSFVTVRNAASHDAFHTCIVNTVMHACTREYSLSTTHKLRI